MPIIVGASGTTEGSGSLMPATITALNPTQAKVDGTSQAIYVQTGHPYVPLVGDRVGLIKSGSSFLAFPIDGGLGVASYPGTKWQTFNTIGAGLSNYTELVADQSYAWSWIHYYLDEAGVVHVGGLLQIGGANINPGTLIATLPVAYRPNKTLRFCAANVNGIGGVEVRPDGTIRTGGVIGAFGTGSVLAASTYLSLDMIHFPSDSVPNPPQWTDLSSRFVNGWTNFGGEYAPLRGWLSPVGDLYIQGSIKHATLTQTGQVISGLPTSLAVADTIANMYVCTGPSVGSYARVDKDAATNFFSVSNYVADANGAAGLSFDNIVIATAQNPNAWHSIPAYANSWATFPGWAPLQLHRNSIGRVYARGLIQSGAPAVTFGPAFNRAPWFAVQQGQELQVGIAGPGGARLDTIGYGTAAGSMQVTNYWNSGTNGFVSLNHMQWDTISR